MGNFLYFSIFFSLSTTTFFILSYSPKWNRDIRVFFTIYFTTLPISTKLSPFLTTIYTEIYQKIQILPLILTYSTFFHSNGTEIHPNGTRAHGNVAQRNGLFLFSHFFYHFHPLYLSPFLLFLTRIYNILLFTLYVLLYHLLSHTL